jgi:hypothetical protein
MTLSSAVAPHLGKLVQDTSLLRKLLVRHRYGRKWTHSGSSDDAEETDVQPAELATLDHSLDDAAQQRGPTVDLVLPRYSSPRAEPS